MTRKLVNRFQLWEGSSLSLCCFSYPQGKNVFPEEYIHVSSHSLTLLGHRLVYIRPCVCVCLHLYVCVCVCVCLCVLYLFTDSPLLSTVCLVRVGTVPWPPSSSFRLGTVRVRGNRNAEPKFWELGRLLRSPWDTRRRGHEDITVMALQSQLCVLYERVFKSPTWVKVLLQRLA